jgi:hypothetical protein
MERPKRVCADKGDQMTVGAHVRVAQAGALAER